MQTALIQLYHRFRQAKPFMLVGRDAECSLRSARTLLRFRELESQGLVRMRAEPEQENYFSVYGEPEGYQNDRGHWVDAKTERQEICDILERDGVWWTTSEFWCGGIDADDNPIGDEDDDSNWKHADSCGMHMGYSNVLDPFENPYVIDEMAAAVKCIEARLASVELKLVLAD